MKYKLLHSFLREKERLVEVEEAKMYHEELEQLQRWEEVKMGVLEKTAGDHEVLCVLSWGVGAVQFRNTLRSEPLERSTGTV